MGVDGGVLQSIAHSTCSGKRAVRALTYAFRRHWRRRIEHTWTNDISNGALLLVQGGGIMSRYLLVFAVLVAIANIALNYLAARIAATAVGWQSMFSTPRFALMFVVGLASLVFMSTLYFLEKSSIRYGKRRTSHGRDFHYGRHPYWLFYCREPSTLVRMGNPGADPNLSTCSSLIYDAVDLVEREWAPGWLKFLHCRSTDSRRALSASEARRPACNANSQHACVGWLRGISEVQLLLCLQCSVCSKLQNENTERAVRGAHNWNKWIDDFSA